MKIRFCKRCHFQMVMNTSWCRTCGSSNDYEDLEAMLWHRGTLLLTVRLACADVLARSAVTGKKFAAKVNSVSQKIGAILQPHEQLLEQYRNDNEKAYAVPAGVRDRRYPQH